jgi:hypothetical protein
MKKTIDMRDWLRMLRVFAFCCWPGIVYAASQSLGTTFGEIGVADWLTLVSLSVFSGLVALLQRVRKSFEYNILAAKGDPTAIIADRQLLSWKLYATCHMTGALFMGFMAFLMSETWTWNSYVEAATIACLAWGGSKFADQLADSVSGSVISKITGFFGAKEAT